jgi:hypothetical protein
MKKIILLVCVVLPLQLALAADDSASGFSGQVVETMSTAGYTYVLVDTGGKKLWAAATQFKVKVGDKVSVAAGTPMTNYHSKSLNRDFDEVCFTGNITVNNGGSVTSGATPTLPPGHPALAGSKTAALPPGHPALASQPAAPKIDLAGIKRADGGKTVQEIFAAQSKLAGKSVAVRGKVVKYNSQIMGKNWLHLRDGSGGDAMGDNDLTVTTITDAKLGDTVLVTGKVSTKKDFGAGYKYDVIIEDATVIIE